MTQGRITLKRTVYFDEIGNNLCSCDGDFWKTCPLRVVHNLPCQEAIISITPIERDKQDDPASNEVRSLDPALKNLHNSLKSLSKQLKP